MVSRCATLAILALPALASCKSSEPITDDRPARDLPSSARPGTREAASAPASGISWVEDDYPAALARARKLGKPVLIDMWAPWCHTCISMQTTVLKDPGLAARASRFVWVSLDTDKEANAAALAKFPVKSWPTFFVISSDDESIQARYAGAASVSQFREFLAQGEAGFLDARSAAGGLTEDSPLWQVRAGDRAAVAGDLKAADAHFARALALGGPEWVRAPEVLVAQIHVRKRLGDNVGCADMGVSNIQRALKGATGSAADFAYFANACVGKLDKGTQQRVRQTLAEALDELLAGDKSSLSVDDHSEALRIRRTIAVGLGDKVGATRLATTQKELLDAAVAAARTPLEVMMYSYHRADAYSYLGIAEQLIPDMKKNMEELPTQYDPPYRLAWLYHSLGRHDEALTMAKRAAELLYGPRKARIHMLMAEIHKARGDRAAERAARQAEIDTYQGLPPGQKNPEKLERARKQLDAMGKSNNG